MFFSIWRHPFWVVFLPFSFFGCPAPGGPPNCMCILRRQPLNPMGGGPPRGVRPLFYVLSLNKPTSPSHESLGRFFPFFPPRDHWGVALGDDRGLSLPAIKVSLFGFIISVCGPTAPFVSCTVLCCRCVSFLVSFFWGASLTIRPIVGVAISIPF